VLAVGGYAAVQSMNRAGRAKPAPVPPTPTDTVHDTVRVAVDSAPAGHSATVADSAHPPVSRQTVAPAAPTPAPATEPLIRTQHPWLTANGDSAAVVDTSHRETLQQAMNEIRGHLQLAGRFIARGDPAQGTFEMREAQTEIKTIRDSLPGERMPKALDRTLLELRGLPVRACYTAAGPDLGGQQRCRDFQQRQRAALARSRGGAPRLP
jgi:hypothetical protein